MAVAREQIVGAVAGQDHLDVAAHELGQEVGGQHARERLVEMPHNFRQPANHIARLHDQLVVVGAEVVRHQARVFDIALVGWLIRIS